MCCTKEVVMIAYFNFNYSVCERREGLKKKGGMEGTKERGSSLTIL